ncbi:hypothetical protein C2845_PM11G15700 [Panicum miliaceum]|uniref:Uncharacterized protein n=1 Tax=Panicum miliaceum TaxID=4540 RepID=A0A3L6RPR8_PANMI|nr:hypothetical protein C2845_PM11G15700 [Panicum miliaceum]
MAPGRKPMARTQELAIRAYTNPRFIFDKKIRDSTRCTAFAPSGFIAETALTHYERLRAQNMMENNQLFQRLGLSTLASWINNTSSMSKNDVSQEFGSLYDAQESEGSEQEEVNKDSQVAKGVCKSSSNQGRNISARGPRGSKRVGQFTMDVNIKVVHEACTDLLKCGQRQMRYRLKIK